MVTSPLSIGNVTFPQYRSADNTAHQANASQQYHTAAPTTTYPLQRWADQTNGVIKQRNEANSAWHIVDTVDSDKVITKSTGYTMQLRDFGKTVLLNAAGGAFTISLLAAATAGSGWRCTFIKIDTSTNAITLDGSGTELVGLYQTLALMRQGESCEIICDGSNYQLSMLPVVGVQTINPPARALEPRSANGCAPKTKSNGASNQPDVEYLAFDDASTEYATLPPIRMPKGWNRGTITALFAWRRATGTGAANVVWGIRAVACSNSDSPAVNFGTGATVTSAADTTTADLVLSGATGACTIGNTPASQDLVFMEVYRDAASGSDTLTGDAWLTAVTVLYSTEMANDA